MTAIVAGNGRERDNWTSNHKSAAREFGELEYLLCDIPIIGLAVGALKWRTPLGRYELRKFFVLLFAEFHKFLLIGSDQTPEVVCDALS